MSYELIQDFQYTNAKKQILTLKKGVKLDTEKDGYFHFKVYGKNMSLEKDLVINNPDYFKKVDWVVDLADILKKNKKATSPKLAKIVGDYINTNVMNNQVLVPTELLEELLEISRLHYYNTKDDKFLNPIQKLGWSYNEKGVYPPSNN